MYDIHKALESIGKNQPFFEEKNKRIHQKGNVLWGNRDLVQYE